MLVTEQVILKCNSDFGSPRYFRRTIIIHCESCLLWVFGETLIRQGKQSHITEDKRFAYLDFYLVMIQYFRRTAGLLLLRLLSSFWIVKCAHQESEQLSDSWFPLIQQTFDKNAKFPLQKCHRRENIAPLSGQQCGGKRKTCFFGDHICGSGKLTYNYPTERCTCNGTRQKRGSWKCVPAPCGTQIQGTQCQDATIETHSWVDSFLR